MDITKVLLTNYLPYAKGTIIGRAIPSIDGLKPAQRRILYTMFKMGLLNGKKTKSSNIVGVTMKLHPHGDMAIYETMVRMAAGNESLNVPYIESKGNFGKVYSKDLAFAAPRYTEAKLAAICSELFDGIDEGAVDFINNFDDTTQEPTLLPAKFPSILVNTSSGIAVSTSSSIPSFDLKAVCDATIGIIDGSITEVSGLMEVLGTPEFSTGGYVHANKADLEELGKTGKQSFVVSGVVTTYPNRIEINEIPYRTNAEAITEAIIEHAKSGEIKEVADVSNEIDLEGFKLTVEIKRGYNASEVLAKLCRLTTLRMSMSFITRVIIDDRCEELGIYNLIERWIEFRMATIQKMYKHKCDKERSEEHLLKAWEIIKLDIRDVANLIANKSEAEALEQLTQAYPLDLKQAEHILDMKIKMFTNDNLLKKLRELDRTRENIVNLQAVIDSDSKKSQMIVADLTRIGKKYGVKRKTHQADPIVPIGTHGETKVVVDDALVNVILTKSGYLKRLVSLKDITGFNLPDGEQEDKRWVIKNNDHVLVFTYSGEVHKILVDSIDASRNGLKDKIVNLLHIVDEKQILHIDVAGDYSSNFNIIYPNGRGMRVYYSKIAGGRNKYKSLFDAGEPGKMWLTKAEQFFMITAKKKAAYCDLKLLGVFTNRVAFKVARVGTNDRIFGIQPVDNVPDISKIDIARYNKEYCVSIGTDELWAGANRAVESTIEQTAK